MEKIIIIGHGSPRTGANRMDFAARMLHESIHPGCTAGCVMPAYLQFAKPTLEATIEEALSSGASRIVIHPYFLNSGEHVTRDIPEIIDSFRTRTEGVEFVYTAPLGISQRLIDLVIDRIGEAGGIAPHKIEEESFRTLSSEADFGRHPAAFHPIVKRVVHATADFGFIESLIFHPDALEAGLRAICAGKDILTDVEMVRAGINGRILKSWGGKAVCGIGDAAPAAPGKNQTRAEAAFEERLNGGIGIVVVGNAPTALYKCIEMIEAGAASPDLVVGVPVGFVRAVESKALLAAQDFPYITNAGRRGGTPVAVAIVNAILKIAGEAGGKNA